MTKKCSACKQEKPLSDFNKNASTPDGLACNCKPCHNKYYMRKRSPEIDKRRKEKQELLDKGLRKCTKCNEVKALDCFHTCKKTKVGRQSKCKSCFSTHNSKPKGKFNNYKACANSRGIPFDLTFEQFESFWEADCVYCGLKIEGIGIDRVDNNLGYTVENCSPCCQHCNKMKLDYPEAEFIAQILRIANRFGPS